MERANYFDYASTTPMDPRVVESMIPVMREDFGNEHSIHTLGVRARDLVESAREKVARLFGAEDPSQIIFTSGATEANNTIIGSFNRVGCSLYEHASVRNPVLSRGGVVGLSSSDLDLYGLVKVDSETGFVPPLEGQPKRLLVDATQALGKIPFTVEGLQFATGSAHKFYGPKGVGAIYAEDPNELKALLVGGGQENGFRSGTLNVPAIHGMGVAAELALLERDKDLIHAVTCSTAVVAGLAGQEDLQILGGGNPYILAVTVRGVLAESLVIECDRLGFAISAGPACSSQSTEPSPVLLALGLSKEEAMSTIRISFGRFSSLVESGQLGLAVAQSIDRLRKYSN